MTAVDVATIDAPAACCAPIAAPRLSAAEAKATAAVFKALSDPHRVRIVNMLVNSDAPVCVCELTPQLALSQATTSFHLKKLVASGLLRREQRGTWAYYSVDQRALERVGAVFTSTGGAS